MCMKGETCTLSCILVSIDKREEHPDEFRRLTLALTLNVILTLTLTLTIPIHKLDFLIHIMQELPFTT